MKTKAIFLSLALLSAISFYSFKSSGEKASSNIAVVTSIFGRGSDEGFIISYGDGSSEIKSFNFKSGNDNYVAQLSKIAVIMNELNAKGYRFAGNGGHLPNEGYQPMQYMVFEKK